MDNKIRIRVATVDDAQAISTLAAEFHAYLHELGDRSNFNFNVSTFVHYGFGEKPAFVGLVAESESASLGISSLSSDTTRIEAAASHLSTIYT